MIPDRKPIDAIPITLNEIQGNILAGFNKDHQHFLFLRFDDVTKAKKWLANIADKISTCESVGEFNAKFKALKRIRKVEIDMPKANWVNIAFTFAGLKKLGANDVDSFLAEFKGGMASRSQKIGDLGRSDPSNWQAPFGDPDGLHAIILLAADEARTLADDVHHWKSMMKEANIVLVGEQAGQTLGGDLNGHEHFGFKDGVSQPGIRGFTLSANEHPDADQAHQGVPGQDLLWPGEFVVGQPRQDPAASEVHPNPSSLQAEVVGPPWSTNGSFLAFRKLKQDVAGFLNHVADSAKSLGTTSEIFGAKLVGRYASGCPMEKTKFQLDPENGFPKGFRPDEGDPSSIRSEMLDENLINNFEYGDDKDGLFVPRSAHIRKAYPRDEESPDVPALNENDTQTHRLLRRGIPFGMALQRPAKGEKAVDDGVDRGLLFLCYQTNLSRQFEFVQQNWVNSANFPQQGDGEDPVMAQSESGPFKCPFHEKTEDLQVKHFVITEGGEYFFQPSISALHQLAK
jgi:Dyp-type peroxidase family